MIDKSFKYDFVDELGSAHFQFENCTLTEEICNIPAGTFFSSIEIDMNRGKAIFYKDAEEASHRFDLELTWTLT